MQQYKHSFEVVETAMRLVREGKKNYYSQYLLNPSVSYGDVGYVCMMFSILLVVRFILAGAHHPRARHYPSIFKLLFGRFAKHKKESKMCENIWYSCWHTFSLCFGVYVMWCEGLTAEAPGWTRMLVRDMDVAWYWFPTETELNNGNAGWPLFPVSSIMRKYYLTELAFWLSCIVYLWLETIRDDFNALLLHHIVTCTLIGFSYICSFWRIGSIILLTHDFADVILYVAKSINYSVVPSLVVDCMFLVFVLGFFVSRLVIFPLFCLRPALDTARLREWTSGFVASHWQIPGGVTLPAFLCILQMLHIFWFGLIIKMINRTIRGNYVSKVGDIRSEDEGEGSPVKGSVEQQEQQDSGSESSRSCGFHGDQRMSISSLPGVRATTETHCRRPARAPQHTEDSPSKRRGKPKKA